MNLKKQIETIAQKARKSAPVGASLTTARKNRVLREMAQALLKNQRAILKANQRDLKMGKKQGLNNALLDRLTLTPKRIREIAQGLKNVANLADPVGRVVSSWRRPNRLKVSRVRIPLGVIGMIYESRPDVTVDAAALCLKSGNAIILRGGSEAIHSNLCLTKLFRQVLQKNRVTPDLIQILPTTDRRGMSFLVKQSRFIDLIIPRGGESLMRWMERNSKIPVIKHDKGVCHLFVDEAARIPMAIKIALNAKVQRPAVCNAMETLLVHSKIARRFLPEMIRRFEAVGVEIRGDAFTQKFSRLVKKADEKDWSTEYLDRIVSIKVVSDLKAAIQHIQKYGSLHTESIVTQNRKTADQFLKRLDSSVVLWNASTRFNDGGQLGLGAEIGISTTKLHAFGPMGLEELTTTKFVVEGKGQIRA